MCHARCAHILCALRGLGLDVVAWCLLCGLCGLCVPIGLCVLCVQNGLHANCLMNVLHHVCKLYNRTCLSVVRRCLVDWVMQRLRRGAHVSLMPSRLTACTFEDFLPEIPNHSKKKMCCCRIFLPFFRGNSKTRSLGLGLRMLLFSS